MYCTLYIAHKEWQNLCEKVVQKRCLARKYGHLMLLLLLYTNNLSINFAFQMFAEFSRGDLVWFDPGIGYVLPGEVLEYHRTAQVLYI
jgi:hypothetical protein